MGYSIEKAGEITLDELSGIKNYREFFDVGHREYVGNLDRGVGCTFWNGKRDLVRCKQRMDVVKALFKKKYPHLPGCDDLPEPPCDFDLYYKDEFTWPAQNLPFEQLQGEVPLHLS